MRRAHPGSLSLLQREVRSAFATACEACGTALRPDELLGPIRRNQAPGRPTICENRITVTMSSSVISRL